MGTPERNTDAAAPKRRLNSSIVAAGVAFGITLAGLGVAAAQTDGSADTTSTTAATSSDTTAGTESTTETAPTPAARESDGDADADSSSSSSTEAAKPARVAETELTGDVAEKVKAAALAALPGGTIIRVETDSDGSPYEAHVRKADGTEVVVKVDADFKVTGTVDGGAFGAGRHGRRTAEDATGTD